MGGGADTRQSGFEEAMVTTDRGMFTLKEAAYLRSLPAVKEVSTARIIYSDRFKVECVRRYLKGESARKIFRDAGLDPALIGNKRVERCVARWKNTKYIVEEATETTIEETSDERPDTVRGGVDAKGVLESQDIADAAFRAMGAGKASRDMFDMRDLIIYQQTRQIALLQDKVDELQRRLDAVSQSENASDGDGADASLIER